MLEKTYGFFDGFFARIFEKFFAGKISIMPLESQLFVFAVFAGEIEAKKSVCFLPPILYYFARNFFWGF